MNFLTVKQFSEKHPAFTLGGLRWLLFRDPDFRKMCIRKVGRRIFLHEADTLNFINQQREEATK